MPPSIRDNHSLRVGFWYSSSRAFAWPQFLAGELGLSGTDAQLLRIVHYLSQRDGMRVVLFQEQLPTVHARAETVQVTDAVCAAAAAKQLGLDVLVLNNRGGAETRAAIEACDAIGQPLIVWDQNGPSEELADLMHASTAVRRVVCVSATQCDWVRHHPIFQKVEFVYNSVDPLYFSGVERRDAHRVVFLGALTSAKGFHLLAEAWPAVRRSVPQAELQVIGSAQLYDERARMGPLGVADDSYERQSIIPFLGASRAECSNIGVDFLGLLTPAEVRDRLLGAAIGVVNPHWRSASLETFCVSAVEMEACGVAVLGGRAGGLRETVQNGVTGRLVRGPRQLASALTALLQQPSAAAELGQAGRRFVTAHFAPGAVTDRWVQVLQGVVSASGACPPPLTFSRLDRKSLTREGFRMAHALPVVGTRLPSWQKVRQIAGGLKRALP